MSALANFQVVGSKLGRSLSAKLFEFLPSEVGGFTPRFKQMVSRFLKSVSEVCLRSDVSKLLNFSKLLKKGGREPGDLRVFSLDAKVFQLFRFLLFVSFRSLKETYKKATF